MVHEVTQKIEELASFFEANTAEAETLGRLPDDVAAAMRQAGIIRMLQPKTYSGYEAHPADFLEAMFALGARCPSSGWISGVAGVHPWNLALCDPKLQEEVWGEDPDTWIASPYTPAGTATVTDDGYILKGRWSFSSGTDHCTWAVLGAFVVDDSGKPTTSPPTWLHCFLPRSDYTIVPDSWNVVGANGTGSKDVIVDGVYIPAYRTLETFVPADRPCNEHALKAGLSQPLYHLPFACVFGAAISGGVVGASAGVLAQFIAYQSGRVGLGGVKLTDDPILHYTLGEAAAEIEASQDQLVASISRMFDVAVAGKEMTLDMRAKVRGSQIRAAHRATEAANKLFTIAGGNSIRVGNPVLARWAAVQTGIHHVLLGPNAIYQASGAAHLGCGVPSIGGL